MNKNELSETVKEMIAAPSCCKELKDAGQNYLNALGTDAEKTAAAALLQEIREDVCPGGQMVRLPGLCGRCENSRKRFRSGLIFLRRGF